MTNTEELLRIIKEKGLKLAYVAQYIGLSRYGLSKKIRNIHPFNVEEVSKLCDLLDISALTDKERIFFAQKVD